MDIEGSVSYASQDPWIFSGTIKENILFGQDYDEIWFKRVVKCCSLVKVCKLVQHASSMLRLNRCVGSTYFGYKYWLVHNIGH